MKGFKFLSREEYNALDAKDQAKYDKEVVAAVEAFRTAHPNGLTHDFTIMRMNLNNKDGRIAIVVKSDEYSPVSRNNDGLSAFSYTEAQLERVAATANVVSTDSLFVVLASSITPSKLSMTIRPVIKGEKYTKADKTEGVYEVSMVRYENESIKLSDDAADNYAMLLQEVGKDSIRSVFANRRRKAGRGVPAVDAEKDPIVTP